MIAAVCVARGCARRAATTSATRPSIQSDTPDLGRRWRCSPGSASINAARPGLQPDPRLPARRRADRAGDRLVAHRRPQHARPASRRRSAAASPTCLIGARDLPGPAAATWSAGIWLALHRLHPRRRRAARSLQTEFTSRIEGIQVADVMDAEPVAIPEERSDRAGARRVLPALPLALVPGGRRGAALRGLLDREAADDVPEVEPRARRRSATCSSATPAARCASARTPARGAARQRGAAPARRADGGRRRRPAARRDHRRRGRPGAARDAGPGAPAASRRAPAPALGPRDASLIGSAPCRTTTYW